MGFLDSLAYWLGGGWLPNNKTWADIERERTPEERALLNYIRDYQHGPRYPANPPPPPPLDESLKKSC